MRLVAAILAVALIAGCLVHVRRQEISVRLGIQQLRSRQVELRRALWTQQAVMGELTAPEKVRNRAEQMSLPMVAKDRHGKVYLAAGQ